MYTAPEVFNNGFYDEKCDIWSCGVILYTMLVGKSPFDAKKEEDLVNQIKAANLHLGDSHWKKISQEAKELIQGMLCFDPSERLSAEQVLESTWLRAHNMIFTSENRIRESILTNFTTFTRISTQSIVSQIIFSFIANQLSNPEEDRELDRVYKEIDTNRNGKISLDELESIYKTMALDPSISLSEIFDKIDIDSRGYISYSEFMTAARDWKKKIETDGLKKAFKSFDVDSDGVLSLLDLKTSLVDVEDSQWDRFFDDTDKNQDGLITYEEFKEYLAARVEI